MAEQRISTRQRVQVLQELETGAKWLNALAAWLGQQGIESEADVIDQAARDLLAAAYMLERPLRPRPPPERWQFGCTHPDPPGTGPAVPSQQPSDQQQRAQ